MKYSTSRPISPEGTQALVVKSDDGDVCFRLRSTRLGLWVQRERRSKDKRARLVQSEPHRLSRRPVGLSQTGTI